MYLYLVWGVYMGVCMWVCLFLPEGVSVFVSLCKCKCLYNMKVCICVGYMGVIGVYVSVSVGLWRHR